MDSLTQPIPRQLSKKLKMFSDVSTVSLKTTLNFDHCEKKDERHRLCISEVIDGKKRGYVNV